MRPELSVDAHLHALLAAGRRQGLFGTATLRCFSMEGIRRTWRSGPHRLFDLASLTKPLATTLLVLSDCTSGRYALDTRLDTLLPECAGLPSGRLTIEALLRHCSGLPAWKPWYTRATTSAELIRDVAREPLDPTPTTRYSDAGFILLGAVVSRERPLSERFATEIALAAGVPAEQAAWSPAPHSATTIAPTGFCTWRRHLLRGEVHDANAAVLGVRAGHAGLFATIDGVEALCRLWLDAPGAQFAPSLIHEALTVPKEGRPLGWDRVGPGPSQAGTYAPGSLVGHLGFTGTSVWLDPDRRRGAILLTNRTIAPGDGTAFRQWRAALHDRIWELSDRIWRDG